MGGGSQARKCASPLPRARWGGQPRQGDPAGHSSDAAKRRRGHGAGGQLRQIWPPSASVDTGDQQGGTGQDKQTNRWLRDEAERGGLLWPPFHPGQVPAPGGCQRCLTDEEVGEPGTPKPSAWRQWGPDSQTSTEPRGSVRLSSLLVGGKGTAKRTFSHVPSQPGAAPLGGCHQEQGAPGGPHEAPRRVSPAASSLWGRTGTPSLPAAVSVLLLRQALLCDALGRQFGQDIVQVVDVRVAVASEVGAKLCLVVDLIPDHCV